MIWMREGDNRSAFPWLGDEWHEKTEIKIQNTMYLLGHNIAMTNSYIGHIDGNHMDQTQINQGCRGYTGGVLW